VVNLRNVFDELVRTKALLWSKFDRELVRAGAVGLGPLSMMGTIGALGRCRVQDLAIDAVITAGGASQAIDRLVKSGHCRRLNNPEDRRSSLVELTEEGRSALAEGSALYESLLADVFVEVPEHRVKAMAETLSALRVAIAPGD